MLTEADLRKAVDECTGRGVSEDVQAGVGADVSFGECEDEEEDCD